MRFRPISCAIFVFACGNEGGPPLDRPDAGPFIPPTPVDCTHVGSGTAYDVGDGQPYPTLGDVPWFELGAGDTVRVHHRESAYREKVLLSNRGEEGQPIRLCGVAGPGGELPVIDGTGATTSPNQHWHQYLPLQDIGVVMIAADADDEYGFRPGWITIEGLVIRGGNGGATYTASDGTTRTYEDFTAGIYIVPGDNVVIRQNVLTDNGLGLFTLSKDEVEGTLVRDILIEGNYFFGNGVVGQDTKHNCYTQALGVTIQYNRFGRLRDGAMGGNVKDRSAGTTVRYNWIEGGARQLDLVDAQEHAGSASADPRYRETFVYGNVIINSDALGDGGHIVHYGGDTLGFEDNFRKGTLYFYNNTIVTEADAEERWDTAVLEVATNDETVDFRNNVVRKRGTTNLNLMHRAGNLVLGVNWVSSGWSPGYMDFEGTVSGEAGVISGDDPGLGDDLFPAQGSPLIDAAGPLHELAHALQGGYVPHQQGGERAAPFDIGAFEAR